MKNNYEVRRQELELMFRLENQMEDTQKAMLMDKLLDDYYLAEHDGDTPNNQ